MTLYEAIFRRKSIRKYKMNEIPAQVLERAWHAEQYVYVPDSKIQVKWKIIRGDEHRLKGLFLVKAPYYVLLYSEEKGDYLLNAGCLMEQLVLYLHTKGIGACYQGGASLKSDDEPLTLVMVMAMGYPAEKLERREFEFKRADLDKLVRVRGGFGKAQRELLNSARLAPSALNRQPWRFVVTESQVHFFIMKSRRHEPERLKNHNLFDAGIALAHMMITAEELWINVEYQKKENILEKDFKKHDYVGTLLILD